MKIYIAGPMRKLPYYNHHAFDETAAKLRAEGLSVVSPAEIDRDGGLDVWSLPHDHDWSSLPAGWDMAEIAERDCAAIRQCEAVYLLDGWEKSQGAKAEVEYAKWIGKEVMYPVRHAPRKRIPIASGVLDYFPDAIRAIANCSWVGNEQHNPGEPLHWARDKSSDHADCMMRHFMERGTVDEDGVRHMTKAAWRALALLQLEVEDE